MRIKLCHQNDVFTAEVTEVLGYRFFIEDDLLAKGVIGGGAMFEQVENDDDAGGMCEVFKPEG